MPIDQTLVGRTFDPTPQYAVSQEHIGAFVAATGGVYDGGAAPATYPIVVAFEAMNRFLEVEQVDLFRIVHGEQRFSYQRPIQPGDVLSATLTVASLRQIGGADIIGTSSVISDASGAEVCTGIATIVHRGES